MVEDKRDFRHSREAAEAHCLATIPIEDERNYNSPRRELVLVLFRLHRERFIASGVPQVRGADVVENLSENLIAIIAVLLREAGLSISGHMLGCQLTQVVVEFGIARDRRIHN